MDSFIGLGVTVHMRGRSQAYTVIGETKSKKTLIIQRDKVTLIKKPNYETMKKTEARLIINQRYITYTYEENKQGDITRIRLVKDGHWKVVGLDDTEYGVELGKRKEVNYSDY